MPRGKSNRRTQKERYAAVFSTPFLVVLVKSRHFKETKTRHDNVLDIYFCLPTEQVSHEDLPAVDHEFPTLLRTTEMLLSSAKLSKNAIAPPGFAVKTITAGKVKVNVASLELLSNASGHIFSKNSNMSW